MRRLFLTLLAVATPIQAQEPPGCEPGWTFPVPFYQSVTWSPDGSRLAVAAVTTRWEDGYRIFLVNPDGSRLERLGTVGEQALYPLWSPDGSKIAYTARQDENLDIYVMDPGGTTPPTRLTQHAANDGYATWSPDGSRIAFHSNRDGDYNLYVMNADGSDLARITDHPADDYNPAWSPDGTRIAFDSDRDDREGDEIYVVAPDGADLTQVVAEGVFPSWSPDGTRLLFTQDGLYVVNVDGSERLRILEHAVYASWSPDGTEIAAAATEYDPECRDHHAVVVLAPNGGAPRNILPR